ncbi:ankyrin repeat domain-containing protein [Rhodovulum marinum]|uniref:Ankyrin repeat protein n=1 Tax=Rhodovulum marinum TaxID=320662 RepID=A0A4R2PUP6_9RHOB|nr:ankyrin repeat domain-containing protein [Rhodovulum marinum]TCP38798.1 ankyrin repeat protein [Rhodovulum marinum]
MKVDLTPIPQPSEIIAFVIRNFSHVDDQNHALKKSLQRLNDENPLSVDAAMELIDTHLARLKKANGNDDFWRREVRLGLEAYVRLCMNLDCAAIPAPAIRKIFDRVAGGIFRGLFDIALIEIRVGSKEILSRPDIATCLLWQAQVKDRKIVDLARELEAALGPHHSEGNWEKRLRDWTTPGKGMRIETILWLMEGWNRPFARALLLARAYENYCKLAFVDPGQHAPEHTLLLDANAIMQEVEGLLDGHYSDECFLQTELETAANELLMLTDPQRAKAIGETTRVESLLERIGEALVGQPRLAGLGVFRGRHLAQTGRHKEALASFETAATWFLFRSAQQFKISLHHLLILAAALQDKRCLNKWTRVAESIGLGVHIPSPDLALARDYPHPFPETCAEVRPDALEPHLLDLDEWQRRHADRNNPNRMVKGYGRTPTPQLGLFANLGQSEKVRALLEAGADPDKLDRNGGSPLLMALQGKNAECVEQLIEVTSLDTVNTQTRQGHTPLHEAIAQCRADWVEALLDKGADVTLAGRQGRTPLLVAMRYFEDPRRSHTRISDPECIARHIERVPAPLLPNTPFITEQAKILARRIDREPDLLILLASRLERAPADVTSSRRIVRLLLDVGADPNQRPGQEPLTPFLYATELGDPWLLEILLEYGANIRSRDEFGADAYSRLNRFGHQRVASELLRQVSPEDRLWLRDQSCENILSPRCHFAQCQPCSHCRHSDFTSCGGLHEWPVP